MSTWQPVRYLPGEALLALYRRRGPVINSGLGREGYTYLLGAEANKFVFANADAFSWRKTFENLAHCGRAHGADRQRRRRTTSAVAASSRPGCVTGRYRNMCRPWRPISTP